MIFDDTERDEPTKRMLTWARNSTIYRLERRMMTEKQLFDAIAKKAKSKFDGISSSQIRHLAEVAVKFAYEIKALDDAAFAQSTARTGLRNGRSKRAIAQKLNMKGVNREVTASVLENADDLAAAVVLARKRRLGPFRRESGADEKGNAREMATLARNGYSYEIANRVLALTPEEAEDILAAI